MAEAIREQINNVKNGKSLRTILARWVTTLHIAPLENATHKTRKERGQSSRAPAKEVVPPPEAEEPLPQQEQEARPKSPPPQTTPKQPSRIGASADRRSCGKLASIRPRTIRPVKGLRKRSCQSQRSRATDAEKRRGVYNY